MSAFAQKKLELFTTEGHKLHLFRTGGVNKPKLIFMSGSGTAAPMYDFKILYEKLIEDFRIIVIEKFGYGYSDLFEASCEIDCVIDRQRKVLQEAEEMGPYILVPHSLSGLEAIRWKQKYPNEIKAIIGLDMATPKTYLAWSNEEIDRRISIIKKMKKAKDKGLLFWFPLNKRGLSKEEIKEQKILWKKNAFNECYIKEAEAVLNNAEKVSSAGKVECPVLMFVSNGKQVSPNWLEHEQDFAEQCNAKLINLNCGHYVHYYKSDLISTEIRNFVSAYL